MIPRLTLSRRAVAALVAVAVLGAGIAVALITAGGMRSDAAGRAHPTASPSARAGYAGGIQDPVAAAPAPAAGTPVRVTIPEIGVSSSLEDLTTDATGKLNPPALPGVAGWYGAGVVPGQVGPAIIAGHIDYAAGPGVFERLDQLRPGSTVQVEMSTGRTLTFRVDSSREAPKLQFPTSAVYGTTPDPQLRLISCAGTFDRHTAHYLDNLVVFATLVS